MTVVVLSKRKSKKSTQSSIEGLVTGKPVTVVSKLKNSIAFPHLQHHKYFLQKPKSKFGLASWDSDWELEFGPLHNFQSTDLLVSSMSYMLRLFELFKFDE